LHDGVLWGFYEKVIRAAKGKMAGMKL